jgi:hypothetical protein
MNEFKCPKCYIGKLTVHYSREYKDRILVILACDKCYEYFKLSNTPVKEIQRELDEIDTLLGIKWHNPLEVET